MHRLLFLLSLIACGTAAHGAPSGADAFLQDKRDIIALAVERVRTAPHDAQRAVKAGENNLRRLHEGYQVSGSTPPTKLDGDVKELTSQTTAMRLERSRGNSPDPAPGVEELIDELWREYRAGVSSLTEDIRYKRGSGISESRVYWETINDLETLQKDAQEVLAFNPPKEERSLEDPFARDQWNLLLHLEDPARIRGRLTCVKAPSENPRPDHFDVGPFYRAAGLLPGTSPLRKEAFALPPGCRTVTRRELRNKVILRASQGRGQVIMGNEEVPLSYDYVTVLPEVGYVIENPGKKPMHIELITLAP